jgi:hypothetical protein
MLASKALSWLRHHSSLFATSVPLLLLAVLVLHYLLAPAYGAQLGKRAVNLSSNAASAKSVYNLVFSLVTTGTVGSIQIQFCANDPFPEDPCVAPAGLDTTPAALTSQSGLAGFSISPASTANTIVLTRPPTSASPGQAIYNFTPVTNPSVPGSYYVRVQTFATDDASGPASEFGGIVFNIANQISISAEVPPYLLFCTGITIANYNCVNAVGDYIDFGEFSAVRASSATSQLLVASNAQGGYAVSIDGTTLTSGNNVIAALAPGDVSRPSTSQFGFNLKANSTPISGNEVAGPGVSTAMATYAQANTYRFAPKDTIISTPVPDDVRVYTSSYLVNVPKTQSPGIYVSTITYICLANF